tara:strand:- start:204 stop:653 length:450 start_codon:yes stop_codon:yes gene_type:complete
MGPYTVDQINEHLARGSLLPIDYAWHEGLPDWVPVTQISGVGHAETHVEYVNGKPKTVRAATDKFLLFWIIFSVFFPPVLMGLTHLVGLPVPWKDSPGGAVSVFLGMWGGVSVFSIILGLGMRKPPTCNQGFNVDKKHYTFFGIQIWKG